MITIVDYGLGNVQAIANIYNRLHIPVRTAQTAQEMEGAQKLILPGVGAFDWAMTRLEQSGMRSTLEQLVLEKRRTILGICVGMQMLASRSDEGVLPGLGWIPGEVRKFDEARFTDRTHLPHMGWNDVLPRPSSKIFSGLEADARFYFLHSYYFSPKHQEHIACETDYNGIYASGVGVNNVFGVQFHPEKSHQWGIRLLKNFAEL
jgi:imidazole glycerol-phosphate synthase subunit HisH